MEMIRQLLGATPARVAPPTIDSDEVYPVFTFDQTKTFREIVVTWTLCFNDVLDADKLHDSLSRLLEIGDWRKLGGRLRLKENGELEIHVPRPFTAERPAVFYTHESLNVDIENHPLASKLPKATEGPSIQKGPNVFRPLAARKDAPETFEDFVYTDRPQLSLHITSFNNATLVGLSWPHTLTDAMGQQALLLAWSLVLSGRESKVPPVLGARDDALFAAAEAAEKKEDYCLDPNRLKGWAFTQFALRFVSDLMWNRTVETRTIFLPKKVVVELKRQAQADLPSVGDGTEKPFISEGDVLTAWMLKTVASSLPRPRPVTVIQPLNARKRLSSLSQASGVYIQNMAIGTSTSVSADIATGPLGAIAFESRRHLMAQSTEPQVMAFLRSFQHEKETGGDTSAMLYCEPNALLMPITNWTQADIYNTVDFSAAVVRRGETDPPRKNRPGTIVFHQANTMRQGPTVRNVVVILGKDHDENYWLTGVLLPPAWIKIEEEINRLRSES